MTLPCYSLSIYTICIIYRLWRQFFQVIYTLLVPRSELCGWLDKCGENLKKKNWTPGDGGFVFFNSWWQRLSKYVIFYAIFLLNFNYWQVLNVMHYKTHILLESSSPPSQLGHIGYNIGFVIFAVHLLKVKSVCFFLLSLLFQGTFTAICWIAQ